MAAVGPADRYHRVAEAADSRLERKLYGQVEVVGQQWLELIDHVPAVRFEGVGCVVVAVLEEDPDDRVGDPVEDQLHPWVPVHLAALSKASAECAVVALL